MTVPILIADGHWLTRAGLRNLLAEDATFEVVGEASSLPEAVALSRHLRPTLVLMDAGMIDPDDAECVDLVKKLSATTTLVFLAAVVDPTSLETVVRLGVGYALKSARLVELQHVLLDALDRTASPDESELSIAPTAAEAVASVLSVRERQVLALLARGCTNREIATQLLIMPSTVKVHVEHILSKLHVTHRTRAAVLAIELGYITPEQPWPPARRLERKRAGSRDAY